ncbi:MAG: hypothetical protein HYY23_19150 [Verrucomicrobia bacterium]|nr:hypothetical protein [Verrucomicrobiota bacterium]
MKSKQVSVFIASIVLVMLTAGMLLPLPWLARESLFEFTARMPKGNDITKPLIDTDPC